MNKNSSTLLDQNPGPCVDCTRGRGLLIIVPVRCENWADLGKFWGNEQMPNICCRDEMQALVLTRRGRDKYFYRWICLDGRPMHIWPQRKKNMQPLFDTIWIFKKFQDICKRDLWKTCGFSGDPSYPRLAHAKVTDYESIPMLSGGRAFVLRH